MTTQFLAIILTKLAESVLWYTACIYHRQGKNRYQYKLIYSKRQLLLQRDKVYF